MSAKVGKFEHFLNRVRLQSDDELAVNNRNIVRYRGAPYLFLYRYFMLDPLILHSLHLRIFAARDDPTMIEGMSLEDAYQRDRTLLDALTNRCRHAVLS